MKMKQQGNISLQKKTLIPTPPPPRIGLGRSVAVATSPTVATAVMPVPARDTRYVVSKMHIFRETHAYST